MVRAYNPWPGSFFFLEEKIIKVHQARYHDSLGAIPGKMSIIDGYPAIGTAQGFLILSVLKPAGKKSMDGKVFLMGYRNWNHSLHNHE
jgi:methionyl-tRNA formyltransferase